MRAVERAEERGCETMQVFNQSPRAWRPPRYSEADFAAFRERSRELVKSVYIHAVYLINVASDDAEVRRKSLASLTHALNVGDAIGARGVIVHPGSGKGQAPAPTFKKLGKAMKAAMDATESCPLLFENTAGAGFTIGRTFEELARVIDVSGAGERVGVCLDSCHLLASGYEVREAGAFRAVVDEYDRIVGLDRLQALHLNDSKTALGSNVDRHANLGQGELGEDGGPRVPARAALQGSAGADRGAGAGRSRPRPQADRDGEAVAPGALGARSGRAGRTRGSHRARRPPCRRSAD